jgi:DNA modification methylase
MNMPENTEKERLKMDNLYMSQMTMFGEDESLEPKATGLVAERFLISPFTILDAKQGIWQERKRAWLDLGIKGEAGRDAKCNANFKPFIGDPDRFEDKQTSVFDPVLCELAYRWFCPIGGQIVDPFAGGSVRGIIASYFGLQYWGCDLRQEQIDANYEQAVELKANPVPEWVCGDSMDKLDDAPQADFVFSCPPYGDLEKYSDDPRDLSNMEWFSFVAAYKRIILKTVKKMKNNTFACFVVGDIRDKKGFYRNFVSITIDGFESAGARLYNEAILATPLGNAGMRVSRPFISGRKMVKVHQNVLVFCKGDWRIAASHARDAREELVSDL